MNNELKAQLLQLLKEELTVEVIEKEYYDYGETSKSLEVTVYFMGEVISSSST